MLEGIEMGIWIAKVDLITNHVRGSTRINNRELEDECAK